MRIFDSRWKGLHGIGRFATELQLRMPQFTEINLPGRPSDPFDPWRLSRHLRAIKARLYFSPGYNSPVSSPCPFVFCIHDLNHLFVPENSSILKRTYYRYVIRPAVRKAAAVLTVSTFSQRAICEWAGVTEGKVVNVGNGISPAFTAEGAAYRSDRPYFLYVGNYKAHKNVERMLTAFAHSGLAGQFMFVATGTPEPSLRALIVKLGLTPHVEFVGKPTDEKLATLYRGAFALTLVSLYEGFGLPIVEAMACGTPVLTSAAASMPEIAGEAAILVDPMDVESIKEGMRKLADDSALRQSLRLRGIERARVFSWDATAAKVRSVLAQVS